MTTVIAPDNNRRVVEWTPPATRAEADQAIDQLITDIGIIQAQLAETRDAWCERTGLGFEEYAAWRRRAIFAKTYKEGQLRQSKRLRQSLLDAADDSPADVALHRLALAVLDAWDDRRSEDGWHALNAAMSALRRHLAVGDLSFEEPLLTDRMASG